VRLLQAAFEEMYRSGYRSADLDAILVAAGVTKGALYYHFDDKEALGHAVVDEVIASSVQQKWVQPLRNATNPIDTLVRIVRSESLKRENIQRGCPLLNLSQEMRDSARGPPNFLRTGTTPSRRHCVQDRNAGWFGMTLTRMKRLRS
jgi:AcrR family transcriptional regulator